MILKIRVKSYHPLYLYNYYIRIKHQLTQLTNEHANISVITLPTTRELFTVLKSPHVDKKARNQYQRIIYKRILILSFKTNTKKDINKILQGLRNIAVGINLTVDYINGM